MSYNDPMAFREEQKQAQPLLYGPTGEPYKFPEEEGPEEEEPEFDYGEPGRELFEERARLELELEGLEKGAEEEEKEKARVREAELERQRRELGLRKGASELERARQKEALRKTGETRWGGIERGARRTRQVARGTGEVAGRLYKIGTLGGPVKRPMGEVRELYIPSRKRMGVVPEGGRREVTPGDIGAPLREMGRPRLEKLRREGALYDGGYRGGIGGTLIAQVARSTLGQGATPAGQISRGGFSSRSQGIASDAALARLRGLTFPKGLSEEEVSAYLEIRRNGDVDIPTHVVDDLSRLGISRQDALGAIKSLIRKGHIRKSGEFGGEPVLEVTK